MEDKLIPTLKLELKDYILEQELGRDDLGTIYRGRRKSDEAVVAIKVIAPQFTFDEFFVRRFKEMARQTAKLEHPNIVRTYEAGQEGDTLYVVRELIEGRPLAQIIADEGVLSPHRMLAIARQIVSALDYAHQKSITHGDLSTHRIYVGSGDHTLVADFGEMQTMMGTSLVKQGYAIGSPETIAPERVHGQGPTRHSDLYSLGILCYQMLVGESPFIGVPAAVLHAQAYEQPPPLHVANPAISVRLSEAIGRMLSKGPELRYNTGAEFARALSVAVEGTAPMRAPAIAEAQMKEAGLRPVRAWWQHSWLWILLVAVPLIIALLVFGFWAVSFLSSHRVLIPPPPPIASQEVSSAAESESTASQDTADQPAAATEPAAAPLVATANPTVTPLPPTPTVTAIPTSTPTLAPLPTPGPPVVVAGSPFTNLRLAHGITANDQPDRVGTTFAPGTQPIYLFFDYAQIEAGTPWTHRWTWGDTELGVFEDVWPDNFYETGTAWVYHSPTGGYQPGPYKVTLEVNGQVVATATFIIQPGGL